MLQFLLAIPAIVLYGCVILVVFAFGMAIWLHVQTRRVGSQVRLFTAALSAGSELHATQVHDGLTLPQLDQIRDRCESLDPTPRGWWSVFGDG